MLVGFKKKKIQKNTRGGQRDRLRLAFVEGVGIGAPVTSAKDCSKTCCIFCSRFASASTRLLTPACDGVCGEGVVESSRATLGHATLK